MIQISVAGGTRYSGPALAVQAAGPALERLLAGWSRRRAVQAAAIVAEGITDPAEVGRRMDPPATVEAAACYVAMAPESPARGEACLSTPETGPGGSRPVPAVREPSCAALLSPP